jgi:hypothetical protein
LKLLDRPSLYRRQYRRSTTGRKSNDFNAHRRCVVAPAVRLKQTTAVANAAVCVRWQNDEFCADPPTIGADDAPKCAET